MYIYVCVCVFASLHYEFSGVCKICVLAKHFPTFITFVKFFLNMSFLMFFKVYLSAEGFDTFIVFIRFLSSMNDLMLNKA